MDGMDSIEILILKNLINDEEFLRKVIPFLKKDYFQDYSQKVTFEEISSFVENYNRIPSKEVLLIETEKRNDMNETTFKEVATFISNLNECPAEFEWLCNTL